jgi:hypothetical protein
MSEVFISYARSTAVQAQAVAKALRALGHAVWLDDELPAPDCREVHPSEGPLRGKATF